MASFHSVTNSSGARLVVSEFGARLVSLTMPDRTGALGEVTLGFDTPRDYLTHVNTYMGATIGRVAGRTANAHFVGGGLDLVLTPNDGPHTLHGGPTESWDRVQWTISTMSDSRGAGFRFSYASPSGSEGYPGTVRASSVYLLSDDNVLTCEMRAVTDAPTPIAMTQHAYWNLSSGGSGTVVDDELWIDAEERIGMTRDLVATGDIVSVRGTGFDFSRPRRMFDSLPPDTGVPWPGIDHTYLVMDRSTPLAVSDEVWRKSPVATLRSPETGRRLDLFSTEPALQVYLGCHLNDVPGRNGVTYEPGSGICLETVRFPDSPLLPRLPSVVLNPDEEFIQVSEYRFSTE